MIRGTNLRKAYETGFFSREMAPAVDGVDLAIGRGETISLIGESGCGKSTLGKLLLMQTPLSGGEVFFQGENLNRMKPRELRALRRKFQMVSQHPEDCLNPRWILGRSLAEPSSLIEGISHGSAERLAAEMGLQEEHLARYPHELSGGELQRAVIARALSTEPDFLVCDEATAMLDISVQAGVIAVLKRIQEERGLSLLFITHDPDLAGAVGDRTAVMYAGQIIEEGRNVLTHPLHPYTQMLVHSQEPGAATDVEIRNEADTCPEENPAGCRFYRHCPERTPACLEPQEYADAGGGRHVRCGARSR